VQSLVSTVKEGKIVREKQRKPFNVCILISIEKLNFILSQGRDQPEWMCDPVKWHIGTAYHLIYPSSLFAEDRLAKYLFL
jgi:hypothetical protein